MVRHYAMILVMLALSCAACSCSGSGDAAPTDAQIRSDISSSFDAHNIRGVVPSVREGIVVLTGEVQDQAEADRAVEVAKGTKGVVSVTNDITVSAVPTPVIQAGNADSILTGKVQQRLLADPLLAGSNIAPMVAGGIATLVGSVPTDAAKAQAEKTAKSVEGITSVLNQLQVVALAATEKPLTDDQLDASVNALLDKQFPDLSLFVQVSNGVVALSGAVPDQSTIVRVTKVVHGLPGVKAVDTKRLTVQGGEPEGQKLGSPSDKKP
ncbi:MAG TPA: BON domain-containing protein [Blastocatellia bacterium]|nr:BON domain-containing protein [Blastocatellia bacterium]